MKCHASLSHVAQKLCRDWCVPLCLSRQHSSTYTIVGFLIILHSRHFTWSQPLNIATHLVHCDTAALKLDAKKITVTTFNWCSNQWQLMLIKEGKKVRGNYERFNLCIYTKNSLTSHRYYFTHTAVHMHREMRPRGIRMEHTWSCFATLQPSRSLPGWPTGLHMIRQRLGGSWEHKWPLHLNLLHLKHYLFFQQVW